MQLTSRSTETERNRLIHLLDRIGRSDESALVELQRIMGRRIYAFVLHRCRDPQEAEGIVTETLYEIWKHPERFRGDSQPSTWMLGIARNLMLMALRSRRNSCGSDHEDIDAHTDRLVCPAPSPGDRLAQQQQSQVLRHCVDELSPGHRDAVHLVYFEELDLARAAEMLGIPLNTIKTRLFHARARLKSCMASHVEASTLP